FLEIFLLATDGFGRGAQARLRSLYEHVAFAAYIADHPEQAERFVRFQLVEQRKELVRAKELFNTPANSGLMQRLDARLATIDTQLQLTVKKYGKQFASSWHDGVAAVSVELNWQHHFFYDYLIPNRYVHASPLALERRMVDEDRTYFEGAPDHD